ncbi:uncharacterized protein LOC119605360 [Lucilia sericata]|uniref:uncharacterized protein LOC119605360 n=1 Tax=Lucilia sericata TaxID=13632 RepID=UPI0018A85375|nr:uncharacterized protein LOC119605360 [Lucilia sericata]
MFFHLRNVFYMSAAIIVLIQLFSSFGITNGIELPLELLHEGVNGAAKSRDYTRRMTFPLVSTDNGVELPPNVEDSNMDLNGPNGFSSSSALEDNDDLADDLPMKSGMPQWLQMQLQETEVQPHNNYHNQLLSSSSSQLPKHKQQSSSQHQHHHESHQLHSSTTANSSPLRRCSIDISSKIPGICQTMGSIGSACVSGDYIDVFNAACL